MLLVVQSTVNDGSMKNRLDPDDSDVIENRRIFLHKNGIALDDTTRLHPTYDESSYCRYERIDSNAKGEGMRTESPRKADALVVSEPGHALVLPVADCIGAVLYDSKQHVLMLSHLGRQSLEQHGGQKSVEYLQQEFGSNPRDISVWLTAAPNKEVYPIWALDGQGMKEAAFTQLQQAGISIESIHDNPADTTKDTQYYSYSEFLKGHRSEDGEHCIVAMMQKS